LIFGFDFERQLIVSPGNWLVIFSTKKGMAQNVLGKLGEELVTHPAIPFFLIARAVSSRGALNRIHAR